MIKLCTRIEICHLHDVDSITTDTITPQSPEMLAPFLSFGVSSFEESEAVAEGNRIINQTLKFNTKQDIVSFLQLASPGIVIAKLTFDDDTVYIYGSLENPVSTSYSRSKGVTTVTATRQTPASEL
jgi:hypothetical protein